MRKSRIVGLLLSGTLVLVALSLTQFSSPKAIQSVNQQPQSALMPAENGSTVATVSPPAGIPSPNSSSSGEEGVEIVLVGDAPPFLPPTTEPIIDEPPQEPVPNQVVIQFAPETTEEERTKYIEQLGGT